MVPLFICSGSERKSLNWSYVWGLLNIFLNNQIYWVGTHQDFMLCRRKLFTVFKVNWMLRKREKTTLPDLCASLIFVTTRCIVLVVQQPGLPPN